MTLAKKSMYSGEWNRHSSAGYALRGLCMTKALAATTGKSLTELSRDLGTYIDFQILVQLVAHDQVMGHVQPYGLHGVPGTVVDKPHVA